MQRVGRKARAYSLVGLLLVAPLALGATCMVIEPEPEDISYGDESNAEAMQEEQERELNRQTDL